MSRHFWSYALLSTKHAVTQDAAGKLTLSIGDKSFQNTPLAWFEYPILRQKTPASHVLYIHYQRGKILQFCPLSAELEKFIRVSIWQCSGDHQECGHHNSFIGYCPTYGGQEVPARCRVKVALRHTYIILPKVASHTARLRTRPKLGQEDKTNMSVTF